MLFAVELLLPEVCNRTFLPVVVATATATSIGRVVFGLDPAFFVPQTALPGTLSIDPLVLIAFAILGVAAGVASWAFIRFLAWCEDFFPTLPGNAYTQNIIGMLLIGVLVYGFELVTGHPHTAGVGYATIQSILDGSTDGVLLLVALLLGKLVATSISLGSGASGGVFSPSLFIGATLGGDLRRPRLAALSRCRLLGHRVRRGRHGGDRRRGDRRLDDRHRDDLRDDPRLQRHRAAGAGGGAVDRRAAGARHREHLHHQAPPSRPADPHHPPHQHVPGAPGARADEHQLHRAAHGNLDRRRAGEDGGHPGMHIIVSDGPRIAGVARLSAGSYVPDRYAGQTLASVMADDFVIAPDTAILNAIITRMNRRDRGLAIVVDRPSGIPRPEDVVGVIAAQEIASAVIANHYA